MLRPSFFFFRVINQNNPQQNRQNSQNLSLKPEYLLMNSSEISNTLLTLMNKLNLLRNEIKV
jgi:hypothetical protein